MEELSHRRWAQSIGNYLQLAKVVPRKRAALMSLRVKFAGAYVANGAITAAGQVVPPKITRAVKTASPRKSIGSQCLLHESDSSPIGYRRA
jgi:hypothetical protein